MNTFWAQGRAPSWLPTGYQIPQHMIANQQQWVQQATMIYYQYDKDRNGVLKKKEFKKAMQGLGAHKAETKHLFKMVDRDHNKVITLNEFINAFLFLQSGGMRYKGTGYSGAYGTLGSSTTTTTTTIIGGQPQMYKPPMQGGYPQTGYGMPQPMQGYPQTGMTMTPQMGYPQTGMTPTMGQYPPQQGMTSSTTMTSSTMTPTGQYPPQQGMQQPGMTPGYPPQQAQQGMYTPQTGQQYPPQQGMPQQGMYNPQTNQQYPPQQGMYTPQTGQYPPQQHGMPQQGMYAPQTGQQYPPQQGMQYPPQQGYGQYPPSQQ